MWKSCLVVLGLLAGLFSGVSAQSAPRYGDLTRDGLITAADTVALARLLGGDSSLVDSTYRNRPDTLLMVANFFPVNLPGLGERTDSRAPGWETPRWKMRVDGNDLSALRRYLLGDRRPDRTVVGQLVPEWRLSGGVNMESGDVQYLGYRVFAKLGPGSYRVFATRRYPDSTLRHSANPLEHTSTVSFGTGYLTPFWVGFANNTNPTPWIPTALSSARPIVYADASRSARSALYHEFAAAPSVRDFLHEVSSAPVRTPLFDFPPGAGYPGCPSFPNALGDTATFWSNPNTGGNFSTSFVAAAAPRVGEDRVQKVFEVMGYHPRVMVLMDPDSRDALIGSVGRDVLIRVMNGYARLLAEVMAELVEPHFPFFPTSSWDINSRIVTRGAPLVSFMSLFPSSTGRGAGAGVFLGTNNRYSQCSNVGMSFYQQITNFADVQNAVSNRQVDAVAVHEIGHLAHFANVYMRAPLANSIPASNLTEGMANLYGFRYFNRTASLSRLWDLPWAQQAPQDQNAGCFASTQSVMFNFNGTGLEYSSACAFIVATVATAVQRGMLPASQAWAALDHRSQRYDDLSRSLMRVPLADWYPQWLVSQWTKTRFALRQGAPWQLPMVRPLLAADTVVTATIASAQQVKVRMDSTVAGQMFRLVTVSDSAVVRIFTRDSLTGASSVQLHNLALTVVRE